MCIDPIDAQKMAQLLSISVVITMLVLEMAGFLSPDASDFSYGVLIGFIIAHVASYLIKIMLKPTKR